MEIGTSEFKMIQLHIVPLSLTSEFVSLTIFYFFIRKSGPWERD